MRETRYGCFADVARSVGRDVPTSGRPVVCVQGLGFVGAAMAVAVASAEAGGAPVFDVIGIELPAGEARVAAINGGRFPMPTTDRKLAEALRAASERGNLVATTDERALALATVVVVNVPLDVADDGERPVARLEPFRNAVRTLGRHLQPGALVVIETTVPPGTCEKVVVAELAEAERERRLPPGSILLAHSPERVMPGERYLESITSFWRVYAGHTEEAADACGRFLAAVVDTDRFALKRLHSTTASETAKVLENSYRATTIAFMEEWGRFAEAVGVDLFEVIDAIRVRPTHSNIRQPGFGVGGYCLTKDPLFGEIAARDLFGLDELRFPFSTQAVAVNREMPLVSLRYLERMLDGLDGRRILLLGVSYRPDVGDTRDSPSAPFVLRARDRGADVLLHDPLVSRWDELGTDVLTALPSLDGVDAVVLAVPHAAYREIDFTQWLNGDRPVVLDANNVLAARQRAQLGELGCVVASIGRGERS